LDGHNQQETEVVLENFRYIADRKKKLEIRATRITYGDSVKQVLSPKNDIRIPLILDRYFLEFANTEIVAALEGTKELVELGKNDCAAPLTLIHEEDEDRVLAMWRLNKVSNWQMLDRRIDECENFLHVSIPLAYHHCLKNKRSALGLS
jgi:hypothetical protein